jgi:peptidoglycan-associated lipoprotein
MKRYTVLPVLGLIIILVAAGCGASKSYVDTAIAEERANREAAIGTVNQDVAATQAEIDNLKTLTSQIEKKADMAINEAKGFEEYQVIWEGEIFFAFNSDEITVEAQAILDQAGDKMITNRTAILEIAGYCDPSGSAAYNMQLGNRRAAAAKYYLVDNFGVNLYRVFLVSHGENKAVAGADSGVSYAEQRKVTLKIWGKP